MNSTTAFPVRVRAASVVPRWSIVWTSRLDSVAQHSYFVTLYSNTVADLIEWGGPRADLLQFALVHDLGEVVTGDIVAPVKRRLVSPEAESDFVREKMGKHAPGIVRLEDRLRRSERFSEIRAIVKAADTLDAILFACTEYVQGNMAIGSRLPSCYERLRESWFALPGDMDRLQRTWLQVDASLVEHLDAGKYDI